MRGWALGAALGMALACREPPPEPLFDLETFELVDHKGQPFGSEQLRGRVWIADFFFTSCPTICSTLTRRMGQLQATAAERNLDVRFVSFSVDPESDTPQVLAAYAEEHGAGPGWTFLTGEPDAVTQVVVGQFKQPMEVESEDSDEALMQIAHGVRFVLVDPDLRIRGLYEVNDEDLERILADAGRLLAEGS